MDSFTANGYNTRDLIPVNDMEYGSFAIGIVIATTTPVTPITPPASGLAVSLASDTPVSASIPKKGTSISFLKFNLTAGTSAAATVTNITVKRVGVGSPNDFANVYLYDGANRLTTGRSVNSTSNEASFANLNISIAAGATKVLSLVADMTTTAANIVAGNVNAFQLTSASAITTTASVSGTFPVTGNSMTVAGATAGTLKVEKGATPTNPNVGQVQAYVTQFKLTASSEDATIKRVALYQAGSISRTNMSNFKLFQGTTEIASVSAIDSSDLVVFDLSSSPYSLPKNVTRTFDVKADISGESKPNDTIKFYVDETTDIFAVGATYGFGMFIDITTTGTYDGAGTNFTTITVQGGQITVSTSGPTAGNVAPGANDHNFMNFSIAAASTAQIKALRIEFHSTGTDLDASDTTVTSSYITDVKVIDTDTNVAVTSAVDLSSFSDVDTSDGVYYSFTDVIDLASGKTRNFKVTADLSTSTNITDLYVSLGKTAATSYVFSSTSIKNVDNNQYITDIVPGAAIAAQYQTVTSSSLAVTVAQTPASESYIKGASNIPSIGFIFTAGTGADIKVSSIQVSGYLGDYSAGVLTKYETGAIKITDMLPSVTLWDGTTQLGTSESFDTAGEATFDGYSLIITKGTSKTLIVKANSSNSVPLDGGTTDLARYSLDITDTSADITAVNNDTQAAIDATTDGPNGLGVAASVKTVITLRDVGTLTATEDANNPVSALVIAGATGLTFGKVKFTTSYEEMKITKLQVAVTTAASYADNVAAVTISGGGQAEVSKSVDTSGLANFTDLAIIVPKDGSAVVTIKADLANITGGADSGDTVQLQITSTNFEAVGTGTSNTKLTTASGLAASGSSKGGNNMYVKATVPTVVLASGFTPATLSNSTHTLYKFTITNASPTGGFDLSFKKIKFDIAINDSVVSNGEAGVKIDTFRLYRAGESAAVSNVTFYDGTGTAAADMLGTNVTGITATADAVTGTTQVIMVVDSGTWATTAFGEETIAAGESKTYEIRAALTGVGVGSGSSDSVQMRIAAANLTNSTVRGLAYDYTGSNYVLDLTDGTTTTVANFIWSDRNIGEASHTSAVDGSADAADWADAYLVMTLPTDYATLSQ
jgi:hypothetical protein